MFDEFGINAGYVEELHTRWLESPLSVDEGWRRFFEEPSNGAPLATPAVASHDVAGVGKNGNGWAHAATNGTAILDRQTVRDTVNVATELQSRVAQLVNAYRVRGHLFARVDPLDVSTEPHPELQLSTFGLAETDLDKTFSTAGMSGLPERATLRQIVAHLE